SLTACSSTATSRLREIDYQHLRLVKSPSRPRDGFFLRAGGPPIIGAYGGRSLHEQSHGESFLALMPHRLRGRGLYILDEPEPALSPTPRRRRSSSSPPPRRSSRPIRAPGSCSSTPRASGPCARRRPSTTPSPGSS